jgi:type I restriction enzyme M protein
MPLPADFEKQLWDAADQLWTNTRLNPSQHATPAQALVFLRYADLRFVEGWEVFESKSWRRGGIDRVEHHATHVVYVPDGAPYDVPLRPTEDAYIGKAVNAATKDIRAARDLRLPRLISGEIDVSSLRLDSAAS